MEVHEAAEGKIVKLLIQRAYGNQQARFPKYILGMIISS